MTSTTGRPLDGVRVLVPRRSDGPDPLVIAAAAAGADPVPVALIVTVPPEDPTELDDLLLALGTGYYAWLGITSAAVVPVLAARAHDADTDLATLTSQTRVAAVGRSTARALEAAGVHVDLVPPGASSAAALLAAWPAADGGRVLLPQGDLAASTLAVGLRERGWDVDDVVAYRTVAGPPVDPGTASAYAAGEIGAVVLTSGSTARHLVEKLGVPPASTIVCCIGPGTADVARSVGLRVDAVAAEQTPSGLVDALVGVVAGTGVMSGTGASSTGGSRSAGKPDGTTGTDSHGADARSGTPTTPFPSEPPPRDPPGPDTPPFHPIRR